ncbi:MAG: hypothetical protein Q8W51_12755 [Candidatus Palauibacterales bacterium]|nr:hypothetical protein [Candidatus Palauibacterales bacterium]MDP2530590.1 hypothetical protein [Candidatus Palauibacterales bacterium]
MADASGSGPRARRFVRRPAAAFLFALFVVANPAYFCPINCLLHHNGDHADRHGHSIMMMGDACHPGPQVTPQQAPSGRELSPAVPGVVSVLLPITTPAVGRDDSGSLAALPSTRAAPPPPPPRA